ncbi:hypothetical protein VKT23_011938 [Stygiomarasmius scandens]|uniref:Uncharacterized protein n=1 Tax=Marasmiellus scandens TaxID=2682957 RepID=A0ABR1JA10_9AGAR
MGLKSTYSDAVQAVQRTCGQNFVQIAQASSSGVNDATRSLLSPRSMGGLALGVLWGMSQMRGLGGGMGWRFEWVCMYGLGADLVQELYRLVNPCICRAQVISALELGLWLSTLLLRFIGPHSQTYDGVLFLEISLVS